MLKCAAIKKNNVPCKLKRLKTSDYCGIHSRFKKHSNEISKKPSITIEDLNNIHFPKHISLIIDYKDLEKYGLIEKYKYDKIFWNQYLQMINYYQSHIKKIVKVQSCIRRYLVLRRKWAINDEDLYSNESKYDIKNIYYFDYCESQKYHYCFDIRTFKMIMEKGNKNNPYTLRPIETSQINKYKRKIDYLLNNSVKLEYKQPKINKKQKFETYVLSIFQKIDMLNNYTDHNWFLDLNIYQLKKFYRILSNIWFNELSSEQRNCIVNDGFVFNLDIDYINSLTNKLKLQNLILNDMDRMVSESQNIEERKLGAWLLLTALVMVSEKAAYALPYLIQN